jgi:hypothetical protein
MGCKYHQRKYHSQTYTLYFYRLIRKSGAYLKAEFACNVLFNHLRVVPEFIFLVRISVLGPLYDLDKEFDQSQNPTNKFQISSNT